MDDEYLDEMEKSGSFARSAAVVFLGVLFGLVAVFVSLLLGGCATTRIGAEPRDIRQSNSYILGTLETAVGEFDEGIRAARIESQGIADDVERIIRLFEQYERAALRLRDEVDSLRAEIENSKETAFDRGGSGGSVLRGENGDIDIEGEGN